MRTTLVVDGYNAINAIAKTRRHLGKDLLSARSDIITITKEYVRSSGYITDFCVVFDGQDKYRHNERLYGAGDISQVFSRTGEGDDKIIRTVKEYSADGRVIVASNDNYVRNMSRGYGARILPVENLVKKKRSVSRKERGSSKRIDEKIKNRITREYRRMLGLE
ncbi:MAG: hypothetical protein GF409_04505 [Candidatus Omnitrophica bacterium]|nr:hypothetical protein [Candidatus Omnitrophota bacterium]